MSKVRMLLEEFNQNEQLLHQSLHPPGDQPVIVNNVVTLAQRNCAIVYDLMWLNVFPPKGWEGYNIGTQPYNLTVQTLKDDT